MIPQFTTVRRPASWFAETEQALAEVVASGNFILGSALEDFESQFARLVGSTYCVGVGNGMDALTLACLAAGVRPGDEVLVPAFSFVATWFAPLRLGATLVPVDVNPTSGNMRIASALAAVTPRTKAVIPVHLYGRVAISTAEVEQFRSVEVSVIEDAAQGHGAWKGQDRAGAIGDLAAFSFYPTKNLGALGDAGAVTTSRSDLHAVLSSLRNYGAQTERRSAFTRLGMNSRLDELQAASLSVSLKYLQAWNEQRGKLGRRYLSGLRSVGLEHLSMNRDSDLLGHALHQFSTCVPERTHLKEKLMGLGVETGIHYPYWIGSVPALNEARIEWRGSFPHAQRLAECQLSLPLFPELSEDEVDTVCQYLGELVG
jgi:dTDP-4-amino-4,6-dideoxygalactose transaminase